MLMGMCAAQAQTCNTNIAANTPNSRFSMLNDGKEIKDTLTGLVWQRCTLGQSWNGTTCIGKAIRLNWQDAQEKAQGLGNGYRLPTLMELQGIVERKCHAPAVNHHIFPSTQADDWYWSASTYAYDSDAAWIVRFDKGHNDAFFKDARYYMRAVR